MEVEKRPMILCLDGVLFDADNPQDFDDPKFLDTLKEAFHLELFSSAKLDHIEALSSYTVKQSDAKSVFESDLSTKNSFFVIGSQVISKLDIPVRDSILNYAYTIVVHSFFSKDCSFGNFDYDKHKVALCGRAVLNKALYFDSKNRKKIGIMLENKWMRKSKFLINSMEDTPKHEFIPVDFFNKLTVSLDYLITRSHKWMIESKNKKDYFVQSYENFNIYCKEHPKTVILDSQECWKIVVSRTEFLEILGFVGDKVNKELSIETFRMPWFKGSGYFEILKKEGNADEFIKKIPLPVIVKSDTAFGQNYAHKMLILEKMPEHWVETETSLKKEFENDEFILQEFIPKSDYVIKGYNIFDDVQIGIRKGIDDSVYTEGQKGFVNICGQGKNIFNIDFCQHTFITEKIVADLKIYMKETAVSTGMKFFNMDFLIGADGKLIVIDINYMPTYTDYPNFKEIFLSKLV